MKFCAQCGNQVEDGVKFCTECGKEIDTASPSPDPEPIPAPQPIEPNGDDKKAKKDKPEKKGKGKTIAIIVAIVLVIAMIGSCGGEESDDAADDSTQQSQTSTSDESTEPDPEPEPEPEPDPEPEPEPTFLDTLEMFGTFDAVTESGSGDSVIDIPNAGLPMLIDVKHNGGGNVAVWLVDSDGNEIDLLVNEIGVWSGTVTTYSNFKNATMLSIEADSSWDITFRPMASMDKAESGSSFSGCDVVYIDTDPITKVTFDNDGDSNFAVWGIGMNDYDLLVNEIGAYNGTVVWNENQSFFIVESNGNWSVSW